MIFTKGQTQSMVIASDDTTQSKEVVFAYVHKIISHLKRFKPNLSHVIFFSDGCSSQFKNRFNFLNLLHSEEDHGVTTEWHFFGTGHGKSACDGLGGNFKRMVYRRVIANDLIVDNAEKFIETAKLFATKTTLLEMKASEINKISKVVKKRWGKVTGIEGTQSYHYFYASPKYGYVNASATSKCINFDEFQMIK